MGANVTIIDSGGANIASLVYALERLGAGTQLTTDPHAIRSAERVILPGVGAARDAMQRLSNAGLCDVVRELTQPVLGVCLGMQLLADASEEDDATCLGIVPGTATRLPASPDLPVPNMGWCPLRSTRESALLDGVDDGAWCYFVHSYALPVSEHTVGVARHDDEFAAVIEYRNFAATQFHPERSSTTGATILANFLRWTPCA